ncbi:MAG: GNAT family N-acetyltransferase [Beijerinckiaceae bacterium]|nr:GNAT family N-acetyltransferase [Beijerinckiaceae bacterium]
MLDWTRSASASHRVVVATDWRDVRDFWPSLANLGRGISGYAFQSREWIDSWIATQPTDDPGKFVFAIVETIDGVRTAFAPLEITRHKGVRVLSFAGGMLCDYAAPLLVDGQDHSNLAELIWTEVADHGPAFDIFRLRHSPPRIGALPNPFLAWDAMPSVLQARTGALEGDWDCFFGRTHGKSTRAKLRRKSQNMSEHGDVTFETAATTDDALMMLDALLVMKAEQIDAGDNTLSAPRHAAFYRHLTATGIPHIRVHALKAGDRIVAAQWGVLTADRYMFLLMSHGEEWSRYSPGLLATKELFAWCFEQKVPTFDFGLGDAPYKARWCDQQSGLVSFVKSRSLAGHAAAFVIRQRASKAVPMVCSDGA